MSAVFEIVILSVFKFSAI